VGYSETSGAAGHAFITSPDGMGMRDLGTLGGDFGWALGINAAAQAVGYSSTSEGVRHAFITGPDGVGMRDLGILNGGGFSLASDINAAGQVVGYSSTVAGLDHAFITGPNGEGMTDLNSLVDLPGGIILTNAVGINNAGQVIAIGVIPEPHSYALFLAGLGLVGLLMWRKHLPSRPV
jgi:probable HAF family extracellular repeat protein